MLIMCYSGRSPDTLEHNEHLVNVLGNQGFSLSSNIKWAINTTFTVLLGNELSM